MKSNNYIKKSNVPMKGTGNTITIAMMLELMEDDVGYYYYCYYYYNRYVADIEVVVDGFT